MASVGTIGKVNCTSNEVNSESNMKTKSQNRGRPVAIYCYTPQLTIFTINSLYAKYGPRAKSKGITRVTCHNWLKRGLKNGTFEQVKRIQDGPVQAEYYYQSVK